MSNLSESLLDSMSILYKSAIENLNVAKVVEATVVELTDSSVGMYSVKYLGQILKAYSNNKSIKYDENDIVYILCQDGNLDGTLIIIGAKSPYSGLYQTEDNSEKYIRIGDSIFQEINGGSPVELCTYHDEEIGISKINFGKENFYAIVNHYLEKYRTFCFSFKVRTDIKDIYQRASGNYGVEIILPFKSEEGESVEKKYTFDISKMLGDPYGFSIDTEQTMFVTIDDGLSLDSTKATSIKCFIKDFSQDTTKTIPDVFIKDIEFYPVDVLPASALSGYYLTLNASEGTFFAGSSFSSNKAIEPVLYVDGNEVSIKDSSFYWFERDDSVKVNSEYYRQVGGVGWKVIKENEKENILNISRNDIQKSKEYKAVVIYNKKNISKTIIIEDLESKIDFKMKLASDVVISGMGKVLIDLVVDYKDSLQKQGNLEYSFSREDYQGNALEFNSSYYTVTKQETEVIVSPTEKRYESQIAFDTRIITNGMNLIRCTVKINDGSQSRLIANEKLAIITVSKAGSYTLTMQDSDYLYKYDANGNSPLSASYSGEIASMINSIKPIGFKIYKDTQEFNSSEYAYCKATWILPYKNTMFSRYDLPNGLTIEDLDDFDTEGNYKQLVVSGNIEIGYAIKNTYNAAYTNNTISVMITCDSEGSVVRGKTNFIFMKEGDPGSNGTQYTACIKNVVNGNKYRYNEIDENGKVQKVILYYDSDSGNSSPSPSWKIKEDGQYHNFTDRTIEFNTCIYNSGEELQTAYTTEWKMFDDKNIEPYFKMNGNKLVLDTSTKNNIPMWQWNGAKCCIIQAETQVEGQIIRSYYPIEMVYLYSLTSEVTNISGGYNQVIYAADGTDGKINGDTLFRYTDSSSLYHKWTTSENISLNKEEKNEVELIPVQTYRTDKSNNYVQLELKNGNLQDSPVVSAHIKPILFLLNTYGFNYMNSWDGNKLYIDDNGGYIMSPIVGAGKKNDDNTFTGIVIGETNKDIGLMAYNEGKQTAFIDAKTGIATFGAPTTGQIKIDGSSSVITGGNYEDKTSSSGMKIDLLTPSIEYKNGNFKVDKNGHLTATGGGSIAGWNIEGNKLKSGDVTLDSDNNAFTSKGRTSIADANGFYFGKEGVAIDKVFKVDTSQDKDVHSLRLGVNSNSKYWNISAIKTIYRTEYFTEDIVRKKIVSPNGRIQYITISDEIKEDTSKPAEDKIEYYSYIGYNFNETEECKYRRKIYTIKTTTKEDSKPDDVSTRTYETDYKYERGYRIEEGKSDSIYISPKGICVDKKFYVNEKGDLRLGAKDGKKWLFSDRENEDGSKENFMYYGNNIPGPGQDDSVYIGTDQITLGTNFSVDTEGSLETKLGKIGDFNLKNGCLYTNFNEFDYEGPEKQEGIYLSKKGISLGYRKIKEEIAYKYKLIPGTTAHELDENGDPIIEEVVTPIYGRAFKVTKDGILTAYDATLSGTIEAKKGKIGNWTIYDDRLESTDEDNDKGIILKGNEIRNKNGTWSLSEDGTASFEKLDIKAYGTGSTLDWGQFKVNTDGVVTCVDGIFSGRVTATEGEIGGFNIGVNALYNQKKTFKTGGSGVYLGTDGIRLGDGFKVDNIGNLYATKVNITGGSLNIGGVSISAGGLSGHGFTLNGTSGKIGGFTIDNTALKSSFASIEANTGNIKGTTLYAGGITLDDGENIYGTQDLTVVTNVTLSDNGALLKTTEKIKFIGKIVTSK